jgi:hypothetical protein
VTFETKRMAAIAIAVTVIPVGVVEDEARSGGKILITPRKLRMLKSKIILWINTILKGYHFILFKL